MQDAINIIRAEREHSSAVARLFDKYRQFYQCDSDLPLAEQFIRERIAEQTSVIFLAEDSEGNPSGFVQLYPSFCSVQAVPILILYDLFVDARYRKSGIGEALMSRAREHAAENNVARLDLLTAKNNVVAQTLYEKLDYQKTNEDFYAYSHNLE